MAKAKRPTKAELSRQYERYVGTAPSPRATNKWLAVEVETARARANANRRAAAVQAAALATSAVGTYRRVRAEQRADPTRRSGGGDYVDRAKAAGTAAMAVAPGAALTMVQGSANALAHGYHHFSLGLALPKVIAKPAEVVTKVTGRAVLPALAAWQAHRGAIEDHESAIRGAGRGLMRSIDVTGIVMSKGLLERGYDRMLGAPKQIPTPGFWDRPSDPKFQRRPNDYERFINDIKSRMWRGAIDLTQHSRAGRYTRTYTSGPKAGTTEVVRKPA